MGNDACESFQFGHVLKTTLTVYFCNSGTAQSVSEADNPGMFPCTLLVHVLTVLLKLNLIMVMFQMFHLIMMQDECLDFNGTALMTVLNEIDTIEEAEAILAAEPEEILTLTVASAQAQTAGFGLVTLMVFMSMVLF